MDPRERREGVKMRICFGDRLEILEQLGGAMVSIKNYIKHVFGQLFMCFYLMLVDPESIWDQFGSMRDQFLLNSPG